MSELFLKIRHVRRSADTKIDISGLGLTEIPIELLELSMLEAIDISNNKLTSLDKISTFKNLKELKAGRNSIGALPEEILELSKLETIRLDNNPIAVTAPGLAVAFGADIKKELNKYFGKDSASPSRGFLGGDGLNDAAALRRKIAELQTEIGHLKSSAPGAGSIDSKRNWLGTGPGASFPERPATASSQSKKISDLTE